MEIKYTINIMHLNNPETIPPTICGKIVFHNASPWCPKDWGSLPYNIPFSVDVLVTNSLGFCLSKTVFISPSYGSMLSLHTNF